MYQCGHGWHEDPCTIITLQGLDIVSDGSGPVGFSALEGWEGGVAAQGGPEPWEHADGGVMGAVYYGPRTITIEGDIDAPSHEEYAELVAELGAVLSRPRIDTLVVDETMHLGLVRQVQVTRTRPVQISQVGHRHGIFTLTVEAASHLREDVDQQSATITTSGVTLSNKGTADAYPVVSLVGPLTNPAIVWPGGLWQYNLSVPAGTTLTVEMDRKRVRNLATTEHSRNNVSGSHNWLALPPGDTLVTRTGAGSGTITAKWRSAWH